MKVYLGIDLGTTCLKVSAYDAFGALVAESRAFSNCYPIISPHSGWSEQSYDAILGTTIEGLTDIVRALDVKGVAASDIAGIGYTTQMHTSAYLDENFETVRDQVILWNDARSGSIVEEMILHFGMREIMDMVNNHPTTGYTLFHALWVKRNEPEVWAKVRRIGLISSEVGRLLTGEWKLNWNDAAGTSMFDVVGVEWSKRILEWADIPEDFLPEVVSPETIIGTTRGLEGRTGIPDGIPVVAGLGDCAAGALGCGAKPGRVCAILGTAGIIVAPTVKIIIDYMGEGGRVQSYGYIEGLGHTLSTNLSAGAFLDRLHQILNAGYVMSYSDERASEVPFDSDSPLIDSRLCGERTGNPGWKPNAKAAFYELDLNSLSKGKIWLAALKSIVFNQMIHLGIQLELGVPMDEVILMGGGTKSAFYTNIFVAGLRAVKRGLVVRTIESGQGGGARGMALLAAHAVGDARDLAQVVENVNLGAPIIPPECWIDTMADQHQHWLEECYSMQ